MIRYSPIVNLAITSILHQQSASSGKSQLLHAWLLDLKFPPHSTFTSLSSLLWLHIGPFPTYRPHLVSSRVTGCSTRPMECYSEISIKMTGGCQRGVTKTFCRFGGAPSRRICLEGHQANISINIKVDYVSFRMGIIHIATISLMLKLVCTSLLAVKS